MTRDPDSLLCDARWHAVMAEAERCAAFGDLAEFGVYKGGTSIGLAEIAKHHGRKLHLFDSWQGLNAPTLPGESVILKGALASPKYLAEDKINFAGLAHCCEFHDGDVELMPYIPEIAFALIDLDMGKATAAAVIASFRDLWPNGAVIIDDYINDRLPGVKLVVDLLLAPGHPLEIIAGVPHSMALIRRKR